MQSNVIRRLLNNHVTHDLINYVEILRLTVGPRRSLPMAANNDIIVSLTTFPARIQHAWIPIELMLSQDLPPDRVVLVLSEEEFPHKQIPERIIEQQSRGLEILWTPRNGRSYNKLLPTRKKYPHATVITIDDDILYPRNLVSRLAYHAQRNPGVIVGNRGLEVSRAQGTRLAGYSNWWPAHPASDPCAVFLTGVGGVLYPPGLLDEKLLLDLDTAKKLCPTADDVWFWAVEAVSNVPRLCLAQHSLRVHRKQRRTKKLWTENNENGRNDVQIAAVVEYFGLDHQVHCSYPDSRSEIS